MVDDRTEHMGVPPSVPGVSLLPGSPGPGILLAGRYRLDRKLGEGGMGEVWEARHEELDKRVAVKLLLSSMRRDAHEVERFLREAKAAARIHHPNIVSVLDLGRAHVGPAPTGEGASDEGPPFIVMELLEGRSLSEAMDAGPMSWMRVRPILLEVTSALAAAHAQGIVHRDLKPSNVHLVPVASTGGGESAKIIDFGIAKLSKIDTPEAATLTRTGAVLGTPAYMSPEQIAGRKDIDHRTDIYSLGVMVFEMLSGDLPFQSDNVTSLITMHLMQPPPDLRLPPELGGLGPQLQAIVRRMLCKDPANRFRDMNELRDAIAAVGSHAPPIHVPTEEYGALPGHLSELTGVATRAPGPRNTPNAHEGGSGGTTSRVLVVVVAGVVVLAMAGAGIGLVLSFAGSGPATVDSPRGGLVVCEVRIRTPNPTVTNANGENVPVVDGKLRLELPRSEQATWITISAPDHTPETLEIVPNRDQSHTIALRSATAALD